LDRLQRLIAHHGGAPDAKLYRDGLDAMSLYAQALMHDRKLEKALALTRQNAADYERVFGPDDLDSINELQNLALVVGSLGDYAAAERDVREALQRYARTGKTDDENAMNAVNSLALYRQFQGDPRGAERLLTEAYPRASRLLGPMHPLTLHVQFRLARVLAEEGRLIEAEELAKKTLTARQHILPANSGSTAASLLLLGRILVERAQPGALDEAESLLQQARTIFIEHLATLPELAAEAENWLGTIRLARNDYPGAEGILLQNAERLIVPTSDVSPNERRAAIGHIVQLYQAWGKPTQVANWQRKLESFDHSPLPQ
jgi:tetratricopeptide (TPR) repeat protein